MDAADLHLPTLIIPAHHTTQVGPSGCCRPTPAYPHHPSTPYNPGGTKWMLQTYTCLPSSSQHTIQPRWDQVDAADLHLPTLIIPAHHTTQVGPSGCCRPTPAYPHHPSTPYNPGRTKWMLQTYTCLPSSSQHSIQPRWAHVDAADLHLPTLIIPALHVAAEHQALNLPLVHRHRPVLAHEASDDVCPTCKQVQFD